MSAEFEFNQLCPGLDEEHAAYHLQEAEGDPVIAAHAHMSGDCGPYNSHDEDQIPSRAATIRRRRADELITDQLHREMTVVAAASAGGRGAGDNSDDPFDTTSALVRAITSAGSRSGGGGSGAAATGALLRKASTMLGLTRQKSEDDPDDNIPFAARIPEIVKMIVEQQKAEAAAKKNKKGGRGGADLFKKEKETEKKKKKKKKNSDKKKKQKNKKNKDVSSSSSSSSAGDDDENDGADSEINSEDEDIPFFELARRKANREAAAEEDESESYDDSSDYDTEDEAGASSSDDDEEDNAAAANKKGGKKGAKAAAPVTQAVRDFQTAVAIPFKTAEQDKACYEATNLNSMAPNRAVLCKHLEQCHSARQQYAMPGYTDLRPAPFFMSMAETLDPQQAPQLINHIVAQPDMECKCLWEAASAGTPLPLRRMIASSAFRNGVLRVISPVDPKQAQLKEVRAEDGSLRYEPTFYYAKTREAFFRNNFMHVYPCPDQFKQTLHWSVQAAQRFRWHRPQAKMFFRYLENRTQPITEQEDWKSLIPSEHRDDPSLRWVAPNTRSKLSVVFIPPEGMSNDARHALHHLFIRMRAIQNKNANNNASLGFDTLGASREQVWARRLAVQCVVAAFMPDMPRKPLLSDISRGFYSTPTGEEFYQDAVELSNVSSKDFFNRFGDFFVRYHTDISRVPEVPPGFRITLFPHQRRSVAFMLDREKNGVRQFLTSAPYTTPNGEQIRFHVNMALGAIVATKVGSKEEQEIATNGTHRGGILADATGTGKTLSILSLITLHPDTREAHITTGTPLRASMPEGRPLAPEEQQFKNNLDKKLRVKGTLLIAPVSLIVQWSEEIDKRAPHLKWLMLHGADKRDKITYADIVAADVIMVTYETYRAILREETYWFKWFGAYRDESGHFLRTGQRIFPPQNAVAGQRDNITRKAAALFRAEVKRKKLRTERPAPSAFFLSRVMFRRIVLDEFHRAGGLTKDMQLVDSDFVWLVSGTPLDADFGQIAKRVGIMDFSFVEDSRLAFSINSVESRFPSRVDGEFFENMFAEKPLFMRFSVTFEHDSRSAPNPKASVTYAKAAILSELMIRNTIDTCPELANVRVTQEVVTITHKKAEKEKYRENLEVVRQRFAALEARGRVHTRMLDVLSLLNDLRRAAIDPFSVTIRARDALAVGSGAQFENENARRSIVLVPASVFSHSLWRDDFPRPEDQQTVSQNKEWSHVPKTITTDSLKEALEMMQRRPPELPVCPVCFDSIMQPTVLQCSHMFCRECLLSWMQQSTDGKCPSCRKPTLEDKVKKTLLTFPIVEEDLRAEEALMQREKTLVDEDDALCLIKRESTFGHALHDSDDGTQPKVPSKIAQVIEIIESALIEDNTSKFLIFTSFPSVLGSLRKLLAEASIGCVVIDASSSLQQRGARVQMFQDPDNFSVRACIVSSRVGNAGITLTRANHLIICEPQNNLDTDLQILGRVKRIGQTRSVVVHRLMVEDTLEPVLHEAVQMKTLTLSGGGTDAARKKSIDMVKSMLWPEGVPANLLAANAAAAAAGAAAGAGAAAAAAAQQQQQLNLMGGFGGLGLAFVQPGQAGGLAGDRAAFAADDDDFARQLAQIEEWEKANKVGKYAGLKMEVKAEDEDGDDE